MTRPVTYVELNSPDLEATTAFMRDVFGWEPQPFAAPDYLVAPHGDGPGVDTGLLASRDGNPRTVPIIRVDSLDACAHGSSQPAARSSSSRSRSPESAGGATSPTRPACSSDSTNTTPLRDLSRPITCI